MLDKTLTTRELETLELLAQGKSNKNIAENLNLSQSTIKKYIENIYDKFSIHNRVQVVLYATKSGIID